MEDFASWCDLDYLIIALRQSDGFGLEYPRLPCFRFISLQSGRGPMGNMKKK